MMSHRCVSGPWSGFGVHACVTTRKVGSSAGGAGRMWTVSGGKTEVLECCPLRNSTVSEAH